MVLCDDGTCWMWAPVPARSAQEQVELERRLLMQIAVPHTWVQFHTPIPGSPADAEVPGGDDVNVDRHPVIDPRLIASQAEKIQFARDVEPNFETGDRPQIDPFRYRRYLVLGWIRDTDGTPPYYSLTSNGENIWRWWRNGEEW